MRTSFEAARSHRLSLLELIRPEGTITPPCNQILIEALIKGCLIQSSSCALCLGCSWAVVESLFHERQDSVRKFHPSKVSQYQNVKHCGTKDENFTASDSMVWAGYFSYAQGINEFASPELTNSAFVEPLQMLAVSSYLPATVV